MSNYFRLTLFASLVFSFFTIFSQNLTVNKVEPANWWAEMKLNNIQLMVYGENLNSFDAKFNTPDIKIAEIHKIENPDYSFIDIIIAENIKPGTYKLELTREGVTTTIDFPVLERDMDSKKHQGFSPSDVIYLITPDRFANGDTSNDNVEGMLEGLDRKNINGRHGGDIQGIINKLDYLKDLGITTIWINPLVENDTRFSYHGYGATDLYNIDARFGTNQLYKQLVEEAHKRDLKIILDHVTNHISIDHPWMKNLPMADWIHGTPENHYPAVHHKMILSDIHGDPLTLEMQQQGWFVDSMPDLNQKNPFVANYIIQNTIWWLEFTGLDGIREDTYPYADQKFLSEWAAAVLKEYPTTNIVGEVWTGNAGLLANYQTGSYLPREFDSNLPAITDFPLRDNLYGFLRGEKGLYHIFETISLDYIYPDPDNLVTFIDNHDVARVMFAAGGDIQKAKLALTILLTTRGIPQILYATEIGMKGAEEHGRLRSDFPGGFPGDNRDAFTAEERTEIENSMFNFLKKMLRIRKENPSLSKGKLTHFPTFDGIYVYFREFENCKSLIIINESEKKKSLELKWFGEQLQNITEMKNLWDNSKFKTIPNSSIEVEAVNFIILGVQ